MQVLCKASNTANDVRCPMCGQGFLVYWTRTSPSERAERREEIIKALRAHHLLDGTAAAHPEAGFSLPEWDGDLRFSAAALLGHAPAWAVA